MLRTRVVWTGVPGTPYYTNFFFEGDTPALAEAAQEKTIDWAAAVSGTIAVGLSLAVDSEVTGINAATGDMFDLFDVGGSTSNGSKAEEPLPFRTQALTFLGTTGIRRNRRVRGRTFLGGMTEGLQNTGVGLTEANRESIQLCYTSILLPGSPVWVVWARPLPAREGFPALAGETYAVTSAQTSTRWSSLRSRGA